MKTYIKLFISIVVVFGTTLSYAQETTYSESVIRINEADIASLTKMLQRYKKKNQPVITTYQYNAPKENVNADNDLELKLLKQEIEQLQDQAVLDNSSRDRSLISNNTYENEQLRYEVKELKRMVEQMLLQQSNKSHVIIETPRIVDSSPKEIVVTPSREDEDRKILQRRLDSLEIVFLKEKSKKEIDYANNLNGLKKNIIDLKSEIISKDEVSTDYEMLKKTYGNYKKQLFFGDNKKTIKELHFETIDELVVILESHPSIDVLVKGFASDKGNPVYNENLSLQRTEAVKKAMIVRGVHPTRVLTQYHGIDYNANNNVSARRVDIELLIRK